MKNRTNTEKAKVQKAQNTHDTQRAQNTQYQKADVILSSLQNLRANQKIQKASNYILPEELEQLINYPKIDWSGKLIDKYDHLFKPVPIIAKTSETYPLLIKAIETLEHLLAPAQPQQIIEILGKLWRHCLTKNRSEDEIILLIKDFIADLSCYPEDLIEQACNEYRRDGKNIFFPTIGMLLSLIDVHFHQRISKLTKLKKILEVSQNYQSNK